MVRARGWGRNICDFSTILRSWPFKSTLDSMCSLESSQYRRLFTRSGRGKTPNIFSVHVEESSKACCKNWNAHRFENGGSAALVSYHSGTLRAAEWCLYGLCLNYNTEQFKESYCFSIWEVLMPVAVSSGTQEIPFLRSWKQFSEEWPWLLLQKKIAKAAEYLWHRDEFNIPRAIPLGHWISVVTSCCLSNPFIPAFSIFAGSPQSDQYIKLWSRIYVVWCTIVLCIITLYYDQ